MCASMGAGPESEAVGGDGSPTGGAATRLAVVVQTPRRILLSFTVLASFAAVIASRGSFFYTTDRFGFDQTANLWLGLGFGGVYIGAALSSHRIALRFGERRALVGIVLLFIACLVVMALFPSPWVVVPGVLFNSVMQAVMWPIVESYVGAGRGPRETARSVGYFNMAWSLMVPTAVAATGVLIAVWPPLTFIAPAVCLGGAGLLLMGLPSQPGRLPDGHPDRPPASEMPATHRLMWSSRLQLMVSYTMLYVLAPLLPPMLRDMGYHVAAATGLACLMDLARFAGFAWMQWDVRWHGRRSWLLAAAAVIPLGFAAALLADTAAASVMVQTLVLVSGEIVFGVGSGVVYFAALYYAMLVKNASVDAGGKHEALIGMGFFLGPAVRLVNGGLGAGAAALGASAAAAGMVTSLTTIGVLTIANVVGGVTPLYRRSRAERAGGSDVVDGGR